MPTVSSLSQLSTSLRQTQCFRSQSSLSSHTGVVFSDSLNISSIRPFLPWYLNCRIWSNNIQRHSHKQSQRNVGTVVKCSAAEGESPAATGLVSASRQRRLDKARTERERKEAEKRKQYPEWAKVLEAGVADDPELKAILGESLGNPEAMEKKAGEFMKSNPEDLVQVKNGSSTPTEVVIRDMDQFDMHLWIELYSPAKDDALEILGSVLRSWYLIGLLGGFNAASMQVTRTSLRGDPQYKWEEEDTIPAMFHNCGDLEFQGAMGRVWVDMGTADSVAWDVLINALQTVNSE